ncbi:hypothetical protein Aduo_002997 [Ancylostoma duodenale]
MRKIKNAVGKALVKNTVSSLTKQEGEEEEPMATQPTSAEKRPGIWKKGSTSEGEDGDSASADSEEVQKPSPHFSQDKRNMQAIKRFA